MAGSWHTAQVAEAWGVPMQALEDEHEREDWREEQRERSAAVVRRGASPAEGGPARTQTRPRDSRTEEAPGCVPALVLSRAT